MSAPDSNESKDMPTRAHEDADERRMPLGL